MGNHSRGVFQCPMEGCPTVLANLNSFRSHLVYKHGLTARETWPYADRFKDPPQDWDKFKRDFEALEAEP